MESDLTTSAEGSNALKIAPGDDLVKCVGRGTPDGPRGRGHWRAPKGRGRGGQPVFTSGVVEEESAMKTVRTRPSHFLALPLHNHAALRERIMAFQAALFNDESQAITNQSPRLKQKKVVRHSPIVEGLDSTIVIDPVRMHITLGVMALAPDAAPDKSPAERSLSPSAMGTPGPNQAVGNPLSPTSTSTPGGTVGLANMPEASTASSLRTVSTALILLRSLRPRISEILDGTKGVKVPLEILDVLKAERMRRKNQQNDKSLRDVANPGVEEVGAGVLFIGPADASNGVLDEEGRKLTEVCELVSRTFKEAGYLTDTRSLKLHCTILNASHRKPARRYPFSYTDILASPACCLIRLKDISEKPNSGEPDSMAAMQDAVNDNPPTRVKTRVEVEPVSDPPIEALPAMASHIAIPCSNNSLDVITTRPASEKSKRVYRAPLVVPPPLPVDLGIWDVDEIQLWVMGSRDSEGRYVSCGGVELG